MAELINVGGIEKPRDEIIFKDLAPLIRLAAVNARKRADQAGDEDGSESATILAEMRELNNIYAAATAYLTFRVFPDELDRENRELHQEILERIRRRLRREWASPDAGDSAP